jgi:tripartite-type tricarboxylate transporter receptor subunit TctC
MASTAAPSCAWRRPRGLAAAGVARPRIGAAQGAASAPPSRPVRIVVGFVPGGLPDATARSSACGPAR